MSADAQHARREWWINVRTYRVHNSVCNSGVKVREVLPGEITITREELRVAIAAIGEVSSYENRWDWGADLVDHLFGHLPDLPEGQDANG